MKDVRIRPAGQDDLDLLLEFEKAMIEAERPFDATIKRGPTKYYDLPALIASPDAEIVVAELGGRTIASGYARIEAAEQYYAYTHHSYLGFMYVVPEHRGKGVNKLVLNALLDWSRRRGVNDIRLEVYTENAAAIRAYEKAGFESTILTMRMSLD